MSVTCSPATCGIRLQPDHTVPYGTVHGGRFPGTSCQATSHCPGVKGACILARLLPHTEVDCLKADAFQALRAWLRSRCPSGTVGGVCPGSVPTEVARGLSPTEVAGANPSPNPQLWGLSQLDVPNRNHTMLGLRPCFVPRRGYSTRPRVSTLGIVHRERRALKGAPDRTS